MTGRSELLRPITVTTAILAAAAALALAGCDADPSPKPTTSRQQVPPVDVDFSASVRERGGLLVIEWSVVNTSDASVRITNRVPDNAGRLSEQADTAYVVGTDVEGQVEIAKRVFPVDDDSLGDAYPWIGVTELAPGARIEETMNIGHLTACAPPGAEVAETPAAPTSAVFCVGVLVGDDPSWGFHETDGVTTVNHGRALAGQTVLCSDPMDLT